MAEYHSISRYPVRLYHTRVNSSPSEMFSCGYVLVYHDYFFLSIKHQVDINDTETVKKKITFERGYQSQVVVIKVYHTYNGLFNASYFMQQLFEKH